MFIYILQHSYRYEQGNKYGVRAGYEEAKLLGVYSTRELAEAAIERYFLYEGFDRYPKSNFTIDRYEVGKDSEWINGFVVVEENYSLPPNYTEIETKIEKIGKTDNMGPGRGFHNVYLRISDREVYLDGE